MNKKLQNGNSIQIGDLVIGFFTNQAQLLNTTFFGQNDSGIREYCTLHTHLYTEIFACGRGTVTIKTVRKSFKLSAGEIAVIPSGILHTKLENGDEQDTLWGTVGVVCSFSKAQGEVQLFSKISGILSKDSVSVFKTNEKFYDTLVSTVKDSSKKPSLCDIIRFASELCCVLTKSLDANEENLYCRQASKQDIDRLLKLDVLLNSKYMYNVSNRQLADELYLSERQLSRFINRHYGIPLHTLVNNKRIEAAATILKDTDLSIEQIVSRVGFNSKSCFYREFIKLYGKTPLQYRKSFLKSADTQKQD